MSGTVMDDVVAAAAEVRGAEPAGGESALADVKQAASEAVQPPPAPAAPKAPAGRDESGRFAPKPKDGPAEAKAPAGPQKPPEQPEAAATDPQPEKPAEAPPARKAPQSWKPHAREKWASVPPEVQEEVVRLDGEVRRVLQDSAAARKFHEGFERVVTPYRGIIQGEPLQVVDNLLRTAAQLQTAPPQHKAALVATIIRDFGVDVGALDAALSGQQPPTQAQQQPAAPPRDPRLDALLAQAQHTQQQRVQAEIAAFAEKAEFFEDVRELAADMLEVAKRRGVALSLEEAYNRATRLHPEVSKVLASRESTASANAQQASTQRARAAASSVKTEPTRGVGPASSGSVHDDVRAAAAALSGR